MEEKDRVLMITLLARLGNEITMNKAFNQVILHEIAKQQGLSEEGLLKEVGKLHATYVQDSEKVWSDLISNLESDLTIEDLLKQMNDNR